MSMRITSLKDVELFEQTPLSDRNLSQNIYEVFTRTANTHPNKIALKFLFAGNTDENSFNYSYHDLLTHITQAANAFHQLGINDKEVVSILLPNLPQNHFSLWGAETVGIANPINPLLLSTHIISIMNSAKTTVLVTLAPFPNNPLWKKAQEIAQHVPTLKTILTVNMTQFLSENSSAEIPEKIGHIFVYDFDAYLKLQSKKLISTIKQKSK